MRVRAFGLCGLLVAAAPACGETWLEVSRITRLPRLPPPATQDAPKEAGWPQPGERIEWVAHVINRGPETVAAVPYAFVAPERTELRVLDQDGRPVADATVEVYRDHSPHAYQKFYAATPDRVFRSDGAGVVVLPGDVLAGLPTNRAPPKAMTLIVGVRTSGARGYSFLPVWQLNMLHFRDPERGVLEVRVRLEQR